MTDPTENPGHTHSPCSRCGVAEAVLCEECRPDESEIARLIREAFYGKDVDLRAATDEILARMKARDAAENIGEK